MKRRTFCLVVVLVSAFGLPRWPGLAPLVGMTAAAGCGGQECGAQARLAPLKKLYQRPTSIPFPDDDPYTPAKVALGESLFFDPILSQSKSTACASCHNPGLSWGDGLARAVGDTGEALPIRAPTVVNLAWSTLLGWDGKFSGIEDVTFAAITSPMNMGLAEPAAIARLAANPGYVDLFRTAFGDGVLTHERIEQALATYERTIVSAPAPFDRWIAGDEGAIGPGAKRGFELFNGRAKCASCHSGWTFTDGSFQDIGTAKGNDLGRGTRFPTSVKLRYAFKVPTLRDVARRAPYMHDGSVATLSDVIDLYDQGGIDRPSRSPQIGKLGLSAQDKADLIDFLQTLTSAPDRITVPVLPR